MTGAVPHLGAGWHLRFVPFTVIPLLLMPQLVAARVVRVEITERETVADEPYRSGLYEVLRGLIHLEVDPDDPANRLITDLALADRNPRGNVEFASEFELHKPVEADRGNRRLVYFVNNRGHKLAEWHFNHQAGGNWLRTQGWSYLWCGWNCDAIESERALNIHVPVVTDHGKTITGTIYAEIYSYANAITYSQPFTWGGSIAYPVASMDNSHATLMVRQYRWEEPVELPRDGWSFARFEDGRVIPDPGHLFIEEGFKPGWLYELVYMGKDPKLTGLGMAAIRDVVSFFRYEEAGDHGVANPLAGVVDHVYAWGHSQSARLLHHYVYQDFNGDEQGRIVLDGIIGNCGGAGKGQFNSRFAQTTRHGSHHEDNLYPVDFFPFNTVEQTDPVTGERGDVLALARESGFLPKIFFVNSSTDYWTRGASLLHTDVEGTRDAAIDPGVRMYLVAGRAHVDPRIGLIGRALLTAMDEWVSRGAEPPESRIPTIADGTLVTLESFRAAFPEIPGVEVPESFYQPCRLDPGPRWKTDGVADQVPPEVGPRFACLVPQVDGDGNEIAGIRLPEIAVPLATFTGWSMRSPSFSRTLRRNAGTLWPLSRTAEERAETGDPRKSIQERYGNAADYLSKVAACLLELRDQRFLLDQDLALLLDYAAKQSLLLDDLRPVMDVAIDEGAEAAFVYHEQLAAADLDWWTGASGGELINAINMRGYELLFEDRFEPALEVFILNTLLFPEHWNAWDSLGECQMKMGKLDRSRESYEKSLELNPDNMNATEMLERIASGANEAAGAR